jgi:hypothetical protein
MFILFRSPLHNLEETRGSFGFCNGSDWVQHRMNSIILCLTLIVIDNTFEFELTNLNILSFKVDHYKPCLYLLANITQLLFGLIWYQSQKMASNNFPE